MFTELKQKYIDSFEDKINQIERALELSDTQALATLIHQIAGSSGSYGFNELSENCLTLEEKMISGADFETELKPDVQSLVQTMQKIKENH